MPFEKHIYLNIAFHTKHAMNLLITKYNYSNKLCPVFFLKISTNNCLVSNFADTKHVIFT